MAVFHIGDGRISRRAGARGLRLRDLAALAAVAAWCCLIVGMFPAPAPAPPAVPYALARLH